MFDSLHSPVSFEPLLDSNRAAAIIRVHPKPYSVTHEMGSFTAFE